MKAYELYFILKQGLETERKDEVLELVKKVISENGEVVLITDLGDKKLAYEIQKQRIGNPIIAYFRAAPDIPKELERRLRISENVLRYLLIKIPDDVLEKEVGRKDETEEEVVIDEPGTADEVAIDSAPEPTPETPATESTETENPAYEKVGMESFHNEVEKEEMKETETPLPDEMTSDIKENE